MCKHVCHARKNDGYESFLVTCNVFSILDNFKILGYNLLDPIFFSNSNINETNKEAPKCLFNERIKINK